MGARWDLSLPVPPDRRGRRSRQGASSTPSIRPASSSVCSTGTTRYVQLSCGGWCAVGLAAGQRRVENVAFAGRADVRAVHGPSQLAHASQVRFSPAASVLILPGRPPALSTWFPSVPGSPSSRTTSARSAVSLTPRSRRPCRRREAGRQHAGKHLPLTRGLP